MVPPLAPFRLEGAGAAAPGAPQVVLLHGFGGAAAQWRPVMAALEAKGAVATAYDLPGHGSSLGLGAMGAKACAEAVLASLPEGGSCHIAGHSFGGAVATLCVLMQPGRFNGATLLSPGGFGPGINADAMRALAEAGDAAAVRRAFEPFHAPGFVLPSAVVDAAAQARQRPGARAALRDLLGIILKEDGTQGVLPLARLAASPVPLTLVWGVQDAILPVAQGQAFPAARSVMLEGVGHMLHDEAPDAVVDAILRGLQL